MSSAPKRQVVLGRRIKGANRDVAAARSKALSLRKKSLLHELRKNEQNHHTKFEDQRFGANTEALDDTQKAALRYEMGMAMAMAMAIGIVIEMGMVMVMEMVMVMVFCFRFEAQRQKLSKQQKFNIDANEESLTHFGENLSNVLSRVQSDDEEMGMGMEMDSDEEAAMDASAHFGGGNGRVMMGSGDGTKTRLEVMREIIAKSKAMKAERAQRKDEDSKLLQSLDESWKDIRSLMKYTNDNKRDGNGDRDGDGDKLVTPQDAEFDKRARELSMQVGLPSPSPSSSLCPSPSSSGSSSSK